MRKNAEAGFTLIELIMVIVILGILAAVAIPKYVDIRADAERSVVESFTGALKEAQIIAVSKLIVCGAAGYSSSSNLSFFNFVQLDNNEPVPGATCGTFMNSGNGNTIGMKDLRESILNDPAAEVEVSGNLQFVTKTGRTITITQGGSGEISWVAAPVY